MATMISDPDADRTPWRNRSAPARGQAWYVFGLAAMVKPR
jgi:hypothetical protein